MQVCILHSPWGAGPGAEGIEALFSFLPSPPHPLGLIEEVGLEEAEMGSSQHLGWSREGHVGMGQRVATGELEGDSAVLQHLGRLISDSRETAPRCHQREATNT